MAASFHLPLRGIFCYSDLVPSYFSAIEGRAGDSSSHRHRLLGVELSMSSERIFKLPENSGKVQPQSCSCTEWVEDPICLHNNGNSHHRMLRAIPEYQCQEMKRI